MVDIEPMLKYNYKNINCRTIRDSCIILYLAFIVPFYAILNYNITTEKMVLNYIIKCYFDVLKPNLYKVSKRDIINDKDIIYLTNHVSVCDFFIDTYTIHFSNKFISLNKKKLSLPILSMVVALVNSCFFIPEGSSKNNIIKNLNHIEEWRKSDDIRNLMIYPEGMRRPHILNPSQVLKKGFIYHSFEKKLPLQIVYTANKDYVIDDSKFIFNKNINLFTYYGPKIDPQTLKERYEKKYKKEYTKDDYYNDVYKKWCKIWKKMDKYRIDSYIEKGSSYEDALKITEKLTTNKPSIDDTITNGDTPISNSFILIRSVCWAIIYYIIFKIIEKVFEIFFSSSKKMNQIISAGIGAGPCSSFLSRFSILNRFSFKMPI
jgi:predicted membrane protein